MRILCIGDVVGEVGCDFVRSKLPSLKKLKHIELVIANGENSANGNGLSRHSAQHLLSSGVDVITTGNHSFKRGDSHKYYDSCESLIRPLNVPRSNPGKGFVVVDKGRCQVCVVNLLGTVFMESMDNPFECMDELLSRIDENIIVLDLHAETTAEKKALGYYLDGRVSAIFGTHTHVQTSDEQILPNGTGFITDVGMCGPINSVLGIKPEAAMKRMKDKLYARFDEASGPCRLNCIIFDIDEKSGKTISVERLELT